VHTISKIIFSLNFSFSQKFWHCLDVFLKFHRTKYFSLCSGQNPSPDIKSKSIQILQKWSVCTLCFLLPAISEKMQCVCTLWFCFLLIFWRREFAQTLETSTINTVLLSCKWSKICSQQTMPGDRNSMLYSHCVSFTLGYYKLLFKNFCILCSVFNRCLDLTTKLKVICS